MKIIEDVTYITRIWTVNDVDITYTITYSEGRSNFTWDILAETSIQKYGVDSESNLGLKLISLCVESMGINN